MAPIVDGVEQAYSQQVVFKRIEANQGDGPTIMRAYRIPGHPTTLVFNRQGKEVQRFIGPQPAEVIKQALDEALMNDK